jgi:hypothetical protein
MRLFYLKKKLLFLKLDKYRKVIRYVRLLDFYSNKIFLICHLNFFSGFSIKLLKDYFCSKIYSFNNGNFNFLISSKKVNQDYFYNYKNNKVNKKNIYFFLIILMKYISFCIELKL